ncbi:MAG: peptide chain release factor N(5)-glutamine methyltransferase [Gallicola sp.]|nr:peptide chain release factor N(5)-glutamine methyltransferase [Gallicola sp.]
MKRMEIGGQALPEGIMMRSRDKISIAKRDKNRIWEELLYTREPEGKRYRIPFIRGLFLLWNFYKNLINSFNKSFVKKKKGKTYLYKISILLNFIAAVFLFLFFILLLPTFLASIFIIMTKESIILNIIEAFIRTLLFLIYMILFKLLPEVAVMLKYHGAEHKTIHCWESGEEFTVQNVQKYPRTHQRCGTNYISYTFLVLFAISLFLGWPSIPMRILLRMIILPFAFIIGYEIFYYSNKTQNPFLGKLNTIFSKLQYWMTTLEPDDDMIEVGIRAIRPITGDIRMTGQDVIEKFGTVDGYLILEDVLGKTRSELKLNMPFELTKEEEEKIDEISNEYHKKPLQYILGHWNFYGREFKVRENVLIPRFDTENLLETVISWKEHYDKILDIGTGSGIIALTLALEFPEAAVIGVDISEDAFFLAEENRQLLNVKNAEFRLGDLFEPVQGQRFDLICSNPPYINLEDMERLDWKVKSEPTLALYGGEDGLEFYRSIIKQAPNYLKPEGLLAFEIGSDQGKSVELYLQEEGFYNIKLFQDLQGFDRVILAQYQ